MTFNRPTVQKRVGDADYRQRSLEAARLLAQRHADEWQIPVAIYLNEEGTALTLGQKYLPPGTEAAEVIQPRPKRGQKGAAG